jgi:hypothetical protein
MIDNNINDGTGNTFKGTKDQVMLAKHGWRVKERRKQGCMKIVRWIDPFSWGTHPETGLEMHDVWSQGVAVDIQRQRNKWNKEHASKPCVCGGVGELKECLCGYTGKVTNGGPTLGTVLIEDLEQGR